MEDLLLLPLIGLFVGTLGTLIGAGGGFILIPILLFIYPDKRPEEITSLSLAVVFFNALSGTMAYHKLKRIDYKTGLAFAIATIPGAVIGSMVVSVINRTLFDQIFGILLILIALYLNMNKKTHCYSYEPDNAALSHRTLTDISGHSYTYSFNLTLGIVISIFVGFISSLLGIGGGIIHVPIMIHVLNFPIQIATTTSQFVLVFMALAGSTVHLLNNVLLPNLIPIALLALGAITGAQVGAILSRRIKGHVIVSLLSLSLVLVGAKLLVASIHFQWSLLSITHLFN